MKEVIKKSKFLFAFILALSFIGCDEDDDNDANLPQVVAGFTYTLNAETGTVTFINISEEAGNYEWNFGDGETSTEINPVKTYPTGTYTVSLTASNAAGGSDTFEDEITVLLPEAIMLPITFDGTNVDYTATVFGGAGFEVVDNPAPGGTNDVASMVGAITNSGAAFEGLFFNLGSSIDLATAKTIKMNFWSDVAVDVLMKLEEGSADPVEVAASHGGTGWEEISFDFTDAAEYARITLFVDGPGTTAGTFYLDDITQTTTALVCTPETMQSLAAADFNLSFQEDPGAAIGSFDAQLTTVDNPDFDNMVNPSCKVGQIDRSGGALFANNQIEFDAKLDFNANGGFKLKVWSPTAGTNVLVKMEDRADPGINTEIGAATTMANAWEELTFPFASTESDKYDRIILFFELNTNTAETYYIDDFTFFEGSGGAVCTPETEQSLAAADFNLTFQADPGAAVGSFDAQLTTVDNPDFDNAVNPSCKVGQIDRSGSALFANNQIEFDAKLDFNANGGFKLKVWSPTAGTNVLVKMEDKADPGINTEIGAATTMANAWEELTFPFASTESDKYDRIILFFELNTNTAETYYIDDFALFPAAGSGGGGCTGTVVAATALPLDFEGCESFIDSFTGASTITVELAENEFKEGINTSDNVLKVVKGNGATRWAGIQNTFASNFDLNVASTFKMKIRSTKANVVFRFELIADPTPDPDPGNPPPTYVTIPNANEWTEINVVFTGVPDPTAYNRMVIKPDNPEGSDGTFTDTEETYYIDDITLE